jgi:hypothetical protein
VPKQRIGRWGGWKVRCNCGWWMMRSSLRRAVELAELHLSFGPLFADRIHLEVAVLEMSTRSYNLPRRTRRVGHRA